MISGKLDTGLETDSPKKTIDLKFTDYSINKFQSDFSKNKKTIKTKITNSGIKGLVLSQSITTKKKYFIQQFWFDGKKFLFKRAGANMVLGHPLDTPKTTKDTHEKTLREYDERVQRRYQRGSTHRDHGGEPSRKGNYTQQSFKHHNELKLLNSLQGKYQNDAQRREFENMNQEALKEADKRAKAKAVIDVPINPRPGRVRLRGEKPHYGHMLSATGLKREEEREDRSSLEDWYETTGYNQRLMGHKYPRPFASEDSSFFLNSAYDPANIDNADPEGGVEISEHQLNNSGPIQERTSFDNKIEEAIYRAKKHLLKTKGSWD